MAEARQGIFRHEKTWREDQRIENGGECKEPMDGNFNPFPGAEIDKRIDNVELRVAEQYVSKADLQTMIARIETHMIRIEEKLDKLG